MIVDFDFFFFLKRKKSPKGLLIVIMKAILSKHTVEFYEESSVYLSIFIVSDSIYNTLIGFPNVLMP